MEPISILLLPKHSGQRICQCYECWKLVNYGKRFIKGHQNKIQVGHNKGNHLSEEARRKMSQSHKGSIVSEETKRKISESLKGRIFSEEHKRKIGDKSKKRVFSEEAKIKMSKASKGRIFSKDHRKKLSESLKGRIFSERHRKKLSEIAKKRVFSDETRKKMKIARSKRIFPFKDTKIEILLQNRLSDRGYNYVKHYPILGQPDIAFPDKKIAIFCDGCYWHACPDHHIHDCSKFYKPHRDKYVTEELQKQGWLVLRYWEHEINGNVEEVVDKIEDVLFRSVI